MDDGKVAPVDAGIKPNFQDMETIHKNKEKVTGEGGWGDEGERLRRTMAHPNEADTAMSNLLDKNGKR
jgi:hypothetical protein